MSLGDNRATSHDVADAVTAFEPCVHDAGAAAKDWLMNALAGTSDPLDTWLCLSHHDVLLGFVSLTPEPFTLSDRDRRVLDFRRTGRLARDPQTGTMIAWIARNRLSVPGSGRTLFRLALARGELDGAVALIVEPHDSAAGRVWTRDYRFRPFAPPTGKLWFPIGPAPLGHP